MSFDNPQALRPISKVSPARIIGKSDTNIVHGIYTGPELRAFTSYTGDPQLIHNPDHMVELTDLKGYRKDVRSSIDRVVLQRLQDLLLTGTPLHYRDGKVYLDGVGIDQELVVTTPKGEPVPLALVQTDQTSGWGHIPNRKGLQRIVSEAFSGLGEYSGHLKPLVQGLFITSDMLGATYLKSKKSFPISGDIKPLATLTEVPVSLAIAAADDLPGEYALELAVSGLPDFPKSAGTISTLPLDQAQERQAKKQAYRLDLIVGQVLDVKSKTEDGVRKSFAKFFSQRFDLGDDGQELVALQYILACSGGAVFDLYDKLDVAQFESHQEDAAVLTSLREYCVRKKRMPAFSGIHYEVVASPSAILSAFQGGALAYHVRSLRELDNNNYSLEVTANSETSNAPLVEIEFLVGPVNPFTVAKKTGEAIQKALAAVDSEK